MLSVPYPILEYILKLTYINSIDLKKSQPLTLSLSMDSEGASFAHGERRMTQQICRGLDVGRGSALLAVSSKKLQE